MAGQMRELFRPLLLLMAFLQNLKLFESVKDAVADCHYVLATTARDRDQVKTVFVPQQAALELQARQIQKCAVMFGPERTGLTNDHLIHADALITIPLNPEYSSLNLAQAVLLVAWEARRLSDQTPARQIDLHRSSTATKRRTGKFFQQA